MPASAEVVALVPDCAWANYDRTTRSSASPRDRPVSDPTRRRPARGQFLPVDVRVGSQRASPLIPVTDPGLVLVSPLAWQPRAATDTAVFSPTPPPKTLLGPPILVVDDEPGLLTLMSDFLSMEGYAVCTATNGAEALKLLEPRVPQLVVLDLRMPVLDGWGFAAAIQERCLKLPMLVMTAAPDGRRWAHEIGAAGCVTKPFNFQDLLAEVERLVAPA